MTFNEYIASLPADQLADYAERAGTTAGYIRIQLVGNPRRVPRRELMQRLIAASGGQVTRDEMLLHFYPPETCCDAQV